MHSANNAKISQSKLYSTHQFGNANSADMIPTATLQRKVTNAHNLQADPEIATTAVSETDHSLVTVVTHAVDNDLLHEIASEQIMTNSNNSRITKGTDETLAIIATQEIATTDTTPIGITTIEGTTMVAETKTAVAQTVIQM